MLNVEESQAVLDYITENSEELDQTTWVELKDVSLVEAQNSAPWYPHRSIRITGPVPCGTARCLAGHVLTRAGYGFAVDGDKSVEGVYLLADAREGQPVHLTRIDTTAAAILGLDEGQADRLFHPQNSLADLWALADSFCAGQLVIPPKFEQVVREYRATSVLPSLQQRLSFLQQW